MRILLVSFHFPPYNTIGAVRTGKTAKYLRELGHDVRILTADAQPAAPTLASEVPPEAVTATPWIDVNAPVRFASGGKAKVARQGFDAASAGRWRNRMGAWYKTLFNFPDGMIGWLPSAVTQGSQLLRSWRPDFIYASAMPATSLLVARRLSDRFGIPWVAEFRDLWIDDFGYSFGTVRRFLERRWERRVVATASGMVTVSEPLAEQLRRRFVQPVEVVRNGFDADDVPAERLSNGASTTTLNVVYTGMIYSASQNVRPLFEALQMLGEGRRRVQLRFCGRNLGTAEQLKAEFGFADEIVIGEAIPHRQALQLQRDADVLLLLPFGDPRQPGIYSGKIFEYLGAKRPILAVGGAENVAVRLIRERGAGFASSDAAATAAQLRRWIEEKSTVGRIADLPDSVRTGLSRREQTAVLDRFLMSLPLQYTGNRGPA